MSKESHNRHCPCWLCTGNTRAPAQRQPLPLIPPRPCWDETAQAANLEQLLADVESW